MSDKDRLAETVPATRVSKEVYELIKEIVRNDRRKISDVVRGLIERGAAAYHRDGQLFEPADPRREAGDAIGRPLPQSPPAEPDAARLERRKTITGPVRKGGVEPSLNNQRKSNNK